MIANRPTRLSFEQELLSDIGRQPRRRRRFFIVALMPALLAPAWLLTGAFSDRDADKVERAANAFAVALRQEQYSQALDLFPEGNAGIALHQADETAFGVNAENLLPSTAEAEQRLLALQQVRQSLEQAGLDWASAQPVAFGGIRAQIFDKRTMAKPAVSAVGRLYWTSNSRIFSIEIVGRICGDGFVLTEVYAPRKVTAVDPKADWKLLMEQLESETPPNDTLAVNKIRGIYIRL